MFTLGVKTLYTIILLAIAAFCVREIWGVWLDRTLQIGTFTATKEGSDATGMGDMFRRLVIQQQGVLFDLYRPRDGRAAASSEQPDLVQASAPSFGTFAIHFSDLAQLPSSGLDSVKIEAAGVNVTTLLTTLRRWIVVPNEITGSIDLVDSQIYVTAQWAEAPGTHGRSFRVPQQTTLQAAALDLAARILFAHTSDQPVFKGVNEDDFCTLSQALLQFRRYTTARSAPAGEAEAKAALEAARRLTESLTTAKTNLIYAYKLAAYIELALSTATPGTDTVALKSHLDKAQKLLTYYVEQLAKLKTDGDTDAQERLVALAARQGTVQLAASGTQSGANLDSVISAVQAVAKSGPKAVQALHPGASISAADSKSANTVGCFVRSEDGKTYLVTPSYVVGRVDSKVVSPALIDAGAGSRVIGQVKTVVGGLALVEINEGVAVTNEPIKEFAPDVKIGDALQLIGRTTSASRAKVTAIDTTAVIATESGSLQLTNLVLTDRMGLPGDGGGPILDDQKRLVGLLAASSEKASYVQLLKPFLTSQHLTLLQ
jgi:hypothetical protein